MANITGQITINQVSMLEVDADPAAAAGTSAPIGSIAYFNSGSVGTTYMKVGAANTAWNISTIQAAALTSGSIPFTNASGYLSQNNASLFWDQTNNRLGIGTNTPARPLSVVANTTAGDNGAFVDGYGANASVITVRKANGTVGSPTAITSGQVFAEFDAIGYGTSQFAPNQTGSIAFIAAENFTNSANGTHIAFYTAPIGSLTETERLRIHSSGRVLIGTTVDDGTTELQVVGQISATDAIRPGNSTDTTNGNIRFNSVGFEFYRGGSWRDLSFPKHQFDDFVFAALGSGANPYDWVSVNGGGGGGSGASILAVASGDPQGIINMTSGTTAALASTGGISSHNGVNKISLGTWPVTVEWRVRVPVLSDGTNTYEARCGLMDGAGAVAGDPTNGVYFVYSSAINGGQWRGVNRSASTSSTVDSAIAVVANTWYRLRAEINSTRTNVDFYVDSGSGYTLIGSSASNIPLSSAFLRVNAKINKAGTPTAVGNVLQADYCLWVQER